MDRLLRKENYLIYKKFEFVARQLLETKSDSLINILCIHISVGSYFGKRKFHLFILILVYFWSGAARPEQKELPKTGHFLFDFCFFILTPEICFSFQIIKYKGFSFSNYKLFTDYPMIPWTPTLLFLHSLNNLLPVILLTEHF